MEIKDVGVWVLPGVELPDVGAVYVEIRNGGRDVRGLGAFGGAVAQFNNMAAILHLAITENVGFALRYEHLLKTHLAELARERQERVEFFKMLSEEYYPIKRLVVKETEDKAAAGRKQKGARFPAFPEERRWKGAGGWQNKGHTQGAAASWEIGRKGGGKPRVSSAILSPGPRAPILPRDTPSRRWQGGPEANRDRTRRVEMRSPHSF